MTRKYSSIVGIMAVLLLVASFVLPAKLVTPEPVAADPGLMQWTPVNTMDMLVPTSSNLYSPVDRNTGKETGSEIIKLLVGNNGTRMYALIAREAFNFDWFNMPGQADDFAVDPDPDLYSMLRIRSSSDGGVMWTGSAYDNLDTVVSGAPESWSTIVWDIAIAPDDPNFIIAAVSLVGDEADQDVYISVDGGANWQNTQWPTANGPSAGYISAMDISMDYGSSRDIAVGTRSGAADANNIWAMKIPGFGGWNSQDFDGTPKSTAFTKSDIQAIRFSPTYNGDSTLVVVYSDAVGTYLATGVRDLAQNFTTWSLPGIEVIRPTGDDPGDSPTATEIVSADLELPSDFSGQSASLRRFYVSTDSDDTAVDGIFRIDDTTVYPLMDTTDTLDKRVASIAYWGTYASGKLLVGERLGYSCTASVPVWFTDSPTTCPVPCWYPAKKAPSGAAGCDSNCNTANSRYWGNAEVVWSPTFAAQGVAYAVTGSSEYGVFNAIQGQTHDVHWPAGLFYLNPLDESAFSLTRNNGETWNQLALIDTRITKLTDVAPAADCTTIYLASVNNNTCSTWVKGRGDGKSMTPPHDYYCASFDSVWRSSINSKVVSPPLNPLPIGIVWERVRVSPTATNCSLEQSEYAILRLAPDKTDGQIIGWAAGGGTSNVDDWSGEYNGVNTKAMAWSPDFGDYWANITPRIEVQDFAFETSTILYVMDTTAHVQKLPYTGTAWSNAINTVSAGNVPGSHTIEALAPDKVLVGVSYEANAIPYSADGGTTWTVVPGLQGKTRQEIGVHVLFDTDFAKNATVYVASDGDETTGVVFRNTVPGYNPWLNMMTASMRYLGYTGPHELYYGIAQTNSKNVTGQGTLYAAHAPQTEFVDSPDQYTLGWSGVERTLEPLNGIPKPGLEWSCLDATATQFQLDEYSPWFTLEPKSLKLCGCLTEDTNATLYAIDNDWYSGMQNDTMTGELFWPNTFQRGLLWEYTDCVAKKGPKLTMDDGTIIGCDPATGRNQEVNFTWEQLCIANAYELRIAKDKAMTMTIWGFESYFEPVDLTSPALVYLAGGEGTAPAVYGWTTTNYYLDDSSLEAYTQTQTLAATPSLECGHTYYWKARVVNEVTNDWVNSPWSDVRGFTIKAGFRVTTPYYGPQLLAPDNGCGCACNAPISFSWSPFKETTEYKFEMSENADMSSPLVSTTAKTTAYQFTGTVKCNKSYYWRVMATAPAPSEYSAVFSFNTQPEPPAPAAPAPAPETPIWVWVIIAIGAILVIVTLVLIFKTRRV